MTTPSEKPPLLLWLDVETTDLDPSKDLLLEVAWRVTKLDGSDLNAWPDWGRTLVPHAPGEVERHLGTVTLEMHTKSGLLAELEGCSAVPMSVLDAGLCEDLRRYAQCHTLHPAGRNVWFDMEFLRRYLPMSARVAETIQLEGRTARRFFDITALRLVGDLLGAPWVEVPFVGTKHRAMDDVNHDVACWRATLRALGGRKVLNAPSSSLLRPEIPSFDETKRRLAALSKAYEDGLEGRIQAHVDTGVRDFQGQLDDMDGRHTRSYIRVGCGDSLDLEMIEARKRLADMFTQQGYRVILTTTYVEVRLS
jgi:oligoribonuclease